MARGRRPHNRNSRKHHEHDTKAAGFDERDDLKADLREALPDAPAGLIGEVARAATLSQLEAKRILTTRRDQHDALDDDSVQRARQVLEKYSTHSA